VAGLSSGVWLRSVPARVRFCRGLAAAVAASLVASLLVAGPAGAEPGGSAADPDLSQRSTPVSPLQPEAPSGLEMAEWSPRPVTWPAAGAAEVDLPEAAASDRDGPLAAVPGMPVSVARAGVDGQRLASVEVPSRARVAVLDRQLAKLAGVSGLLLRLERTDGGRTAGPVVVQIDVSGFAGAFGGDWMSRLRLYRFPDCVLTTPENEGCATPTPVAGSLLNNRTAMLSARVDVGPVAVITSDPVQRKLAQIDGLATEEGVFAVMAAGASSDTGDFTKTPYSASYEWQAGDSGAGFSWSYDFDVPPVPGDLDPEIELGYSSGAVDGQTAGKNVQPGLVGEGWNFNPGFIDRSYRACVDDQEPVAPVYSNPTGDLCWRLPNARLVWGGTSSELIPDAATGVWHAADDDGMRVELVASFWSQSDLMFSPGDWDGDGNADVMYRRRSDGYLLMARGDGAGGWLGGGGSTVVGDFGGAKAIFSPGDWDGDGKRDLLWHRASDGALLLIAGNGTGGWKTGVSVLVGNFGGANVVFSPGDFDGDGKPDVLWRRVSDGALLLIVGNGTGGWKTGVSVVIGGGWGGMDAIMSPGDFTGDAKADVIARKAADHNLYLYPGNGSGGWGSGAGTLIGTGFGTDVLFSGGDFDGDAKADVLWRQLTSKDVMLTAGNGASGWKTGGSINVTAAVRTGTGDDEHWKVTTTDGTQYFFGRSRLPNWAAGKRETNGQWTVPVFANHADEPCFNSAGFTSSFCSMAWRWNLDYVVDRHGNSMSYFYSRDTNRSGLAGNPNSTGGYDRAGWLDRIEYGTRAGSELATTTPPAKVTFSYAERCLSACWSGTPWSSNPTTANWPDTPWDLKCAAAPCTTNTSPSFWGTRRLAGVTTQLWSGSGSTYNDVDRWDFTHQFPATGNGTSPVLWLAKIDHAGKANGGNVALPQVTFGGVRFDQRADYDPNAGMAQPRKWRVGTVDTETGGQIAVTYSGQDSGCQFGSPFPNPDQNTKRCFPQYYTPQQAPPGWSWWHKYIVTTVTEKDLVGGSPDVEHAYSYSTAGSSTAVLWAHDDGADTWAASLAKRSWGDWRGYPTVTVTTGPASGTRTQTKSLYFRGLRNDYTDTGENRAATITDSEGGVQNDNEHLAGFLREQTEYASPGGQALSRTIRTPVAYQTGQRSLSSGWAVPTKHTSYINRVATERTYTWLAGSSSWRQTRTDYTHDPTYGLVTEVNDWGDYSVGADNRCTRHTYTSNTSKYLIDFPKQVETVGVQCGTTPVYPADFVSGIRYVYDDLAYGAAPTVGNITWSTEAASFSGQTPSYATMFRGGYDAYGRITSSKDALSRETLTAYTQNVAGLTVTEKETNPAGHVTTTTLDPAWGEPTKEVDENNKVTEASYDALGRLTKVWLPGRSKATDTPNAEYVYTVRKSGGATAVQTKELGPNGNQISSYELYDGLLRPRQVQTTAPDGKRTITDTAYDGRGLESKESTFYNSASGPTDVLVSFADSAVAKQSRYIYDGLERQTVDADWANNVFQTQTTMVYDGDRVAVIPPVGDTTTQELFDARGRITERRMFASTDLNGPFDKTTYSYDDDDQLTRVTDPTGRYWSYGYDLLGRQTSSGDPDKGTSTMTYDNAGQLLTNTDSRGKTLAYSYDSLGRKTGMYDTTTAGTKLAEWVYDSPAKGQLTWSKRFDNGNVYKIEVTGYDDGYRPTGTAVTLSAAEGALAGTYTSTTTYKVDGSVDTVTLPAVGGLPAETVTTSYSNTGYKTAEVGLNTYLASASYDYDGLLLQSVLGSGDKRVQLTNTLDAATRRLTKAEVHTERPAAPGSWDEQLTEAYSYDGGDNITAVAETQAGNPVANQCFRYDALHRLTQAWTTTATACQASPSQGIVGGADPYWHTYSYDTVGNRTGFTAHSGTGDTTHTYNYDATQPHAVDSVDTAGPGGASTASYGYDTAGNATSRPGPGGAQTLTWNLEGDLVTVSDGGQDTTFVYDADGNRLIRRDPDGTVTAYLGSTELRKDPAGAVTATRLYGTTAVRSTTGGLTWIAGDHHGTGQVAVDADDLTVSRRRLDPFGVDRATPATWPGEKGFIRGTQDPTGLTHIGAREYDPSLGRFISVDPVFDTDDPQSMTGYSYCNADPVNCVDADGRWGFKKFFSKVAAVASVASMIPGPIGTAAGLISAGAYLAAGNKTEALWALAAAAAALVGAGAVVKGARLAVGAVKHVSKAVKQAKRVEKAIVRSGKMKKAKEVGRGVKVHMIAKGLTRPLEKLSRGRIKVDRRLPGSKLRPDWRIGKRTAIEMKRGSKAGIKSGRSALNRYRKADPAIRGGYLLTYPKRPWHLWGWKLRRLI
jgi:RHS repeat-associated protein